MTQRLQEIFEKYHYPGKNKFISILHKLGIKESIQNVDDFLRKQSINQVFNEQPATHGHIVSFQYLDRVQMDIIDMSTFYNTNSHFNYILLIIDVFSRKLWVYALKNKNIESVQKALEAFMDNNKPHIIISDNEAAFTSAKLQSLLKANNIKHITCDSGDHKVLGVIDRVCRTIKVNIYKFMTENNTTKYLDHLKDIIGSYNDSPHRSILYLSPNEATQTEHAHALFELNLKKGKNNKSQTNSNFSVGDTVRVRNKKKTFERAYEPKYSDIKTITNIGKQHVTFQDGTTTNIRRLKKVNQPIEKTRHDIDEVQEARKEHKAVKKIRSQGLDAANIIEERRRR